MNVAATAIVLRDAGRGHAADQTGFDHAHAARDGREAAEHDASELMMMSSASGSDVAVGVQCGVEHEGEDDLRREVPAEEHHRLARRA